MTATDIFLCLSMLFLQEILFWCGHGKTVLQWLLIYNDDIWKYVCHVNQCVVHIENKFCHPGGHYWDYYPGALSVSQVTAIHLKIRRVPVYQISSDQTSNYNEVAETWIQDSSTSNDCWTIYPVA